MGLNDHTYAYAGPIPSDWDLGPFIPIGPPIPDLTPERAWQEIERALLRLDSDEFRIMQELDKLDDDARRRVHAWLTARLAPTPGAVPR